MPNDAEVGKDIFAGSLLESSRDRREVRRTFLRRFTALAWLKLPRGESYELSDRNGAIFQKRIDDLDSGHRLTGIQVFREHSGAVLLLGRRENQAVPK